MKKGLLIIVVFGAVYAFGVTSFLNMAKQWRPMGSHAMTVREDRQEKAVVFEAEKPAGMDKIVLWPLASYPYGFGKVEKMTWEMKIEPADARVANGQLFFANQGPISGRFPFVLPQPGSGWQRLEVDLRREGYEMRTKSTVQILLELMSANVICKVRNLTMWTGEGKEFTVEDTQENRVAMMPIQPLDDVRQWYVEPDVPATLTLGCSWEEGRKVRYEIRDYDGKAWRKDGSAVVAAGRLKVTETWPAGYYELVFPEVEGLVVGVCSQRKLMGERDAFFAIEGLMEGRGEMGLSMVDVLLAHGIGCSREWYNYSVYAGNKGQFKENSPFYVKSGAKGFKSIFCFADFPSWYGPEPGRRSIPQHLLTLSDHVGQVVGWRKSGLDAFHVLNEYDGAERPAESALPVIKTAGYAMRAYPEIRFAGAPFCMGKQSHEMVRESVRNGLLDYTDIFTCHTYDTPESLEEMVAGYREALSGHAKQWLPMWITESGKPWSRKLTQAQQEMLGGPHGGPLGALHPEVDEDRVSALWIVMKVVEAKCCGVERIFPFTMPFFQENNNNFGMLDRWQTPLRSLTGYFQAARELSGYEYVGDWSEKVDGVSRFRVFRRGGDWKAVVYAGSQSAAQTKTVSLAGVPVKALRLLDGRLAEQSADGDVVVTGGLLYVDLAAELPAGKLKTDTRANALRQSALAYRPVPRVFSPVVYQFRHWEYPERGKSYYVLDKNSFKVRLYNFGSTPVAIAPELVLPEGGRVLTKPFAGELTLPPNSERDVEWTMDLTGVNKVDFDIRLKDRLNEYTEICVPFMNLTTIEYRAYGLNDVSRWRRNTNGTTTLSFDEQEQAIRVETVFDESKPDYWVFPEYVLKLPEESLKGAFGIEFDIKFQQSGKAQTVSAPLVMLAYTDENEKGKWDGLAYAMPTAEWGHRRVLFKVPEDDRYRQLRIGMCPKGTKVTYWLRNIRLLYSGQAGK